ncbi:MAG: hypothetical protein HY822_11225 [Acidobacteria bacterium]|nr:hypothetical protein [Acidobacteriota bacterium]
MNRTVTAVLLAAALVSVASAAQDDDDSRDRAERVLAAQLVPAAELTGGMPADLFPGKAGSDPLKFGSVEVFAHRKAEVWLRGAAPRARYQVYFCRFPSAATRCAQQGVVETDASGNTQDLLDFILDGNTTAGVFLLTRTGLGVTTEYVSGFTLSPAPPPANAAAIRLQGTVQSVDSSRSAFRMASFPIEIVVGSATRFKHTDGLGDLRTGLSLTVEGYAMADGRVFATDVDADTRGPKN